MLTGLILIKSSIPVFKGCVEGRNTVSGTRIVFMAGVLKKRASSTQWQTPTFNGGCNGPASATYPSGNKYRKPKYKS